MRIREEAIGSCHMKNGCVCDGSRATMRIKDCKPNPLKAAYK